MFRKTVTYTDYEGTERTESFYFHLTDAELVKLNFSRSGGLEKTLHRIIASKNEQEIMNEFTTIIRESYGEKSPDGRRFIKSKELTDAFMQTEAYSMIFMDLITKQGEGAAFVNGLVSRDHQPQTESN